MWIFTKQGMFSAVCARTGDGEKGNPPDNKRMMVRARCRKHLEALLRECKHILVGVEIVESKTTDYRFRIFVEKYRWQRVLLKLSEEQAYDNFKSATAVQQGEDGKSYIDALHHVWSVMYGLQEKEHGPGIYSRPSKDLHSLDFSDLDSGPIMEEPIPEAPVVAVREQETGDLLGVMWHVEECYSSSEEAYADAVKVDAIKLVSHPEFEACSWSKVSKASGPVFDPYLYAEEENGN